MAESSRMAGYPPEELDHNARQLFDQVRIAVRSNLRELTKRVISMLQEAIPAYSAITAEDLIDGVAGDIGRAIDAVAGGRHATPEELTACEEVGELRAMQGVPVEALIQAFQVAADQTLTFALAEADRLLAGPQEQLLFSRMGWAWANEAMTCAARAHRRTELELARRDVHQRNELLRGLVLGSVPAAEVQLRLPLYGMNPAASYYVLRARPLDTGLAAEDLVDTLRRRRPTGALIGMVEGDVVLVDSEPPDLVNGWCAGLAGPTSISAVHAHYDEASRALHTAWSFAREGCHRLEDLGLLPSVMLDRRIGEMLVARCIQPLGGPAHQERIVATIHALFASEFSVPDAARALYVHENTVRKRLRAAEERTGMNFKRIEDLVAMWWAIQFRAASGRADNSAS